MKRYSIHVSLFLLMLPFIAHADGPTTNTDYVVTPPNFGEMSYEDADKAVNGVIDSVVTTKLKRVGPEFVTGLVDQLRLGKLADEKKVLVIYLLGYLHPKDTNSVEVLIENIDLKAPRFDPKFDIARWGMYPAEEALVRIGIPSVNPILNHLPNEENPVRRHLMCAVLKSVERSEAAIDQLKQRLSDELNPSRQENLRLSLKEIEE